ncbi:MAG: L-Lysine--8-amino-7-oxononanoate transaminase [Acidimicrobiales bacterium]|nr:MAG: adenosylmethionine--8-amino-7-oxononanoate transaminase [Actinomycetota bacterium]MBV6508157.1 L-Lysine--8-amino-7-oxononanoate transaminase [Acidimicrobiales bacterium]RIK08187.1 MAG: adenosylmethionine--8-amino-7-oxononanoate transaminase [Acidobacteriota bacterium]
MASMDEWIRRDEAVIWHGFTQMSCFADNEPLIIERAAGNELIDVDGRRYFDGISSLWVTTLGHRIPELDEALIEQTRRIAHSTLLGNGNRATVEFAEALGEVVPVERPHLLFASDGAAAVEQALKIAFQYWVNRGEHRRHTYLALGGAYHGDSIGSLSLGAGGFGTDLFDPLRFPVLRVPGYEDPDWAGRAVQTIDDHASELAAIVLEPLVQGASGMQTTDPDSVLQVVTRAQEAGLLVIADEVATGFGRTGALFASELSSVVPDLLCLGKGMTGGYLPMSATVANERVYDAFLGPDSSEVTFHHGHSYSGNALAAAVGHRHLELIEEWDVLVNVAERAQELAKLLDEQIKMHPAVQAIRQRGLMVGVELAPPEQGLRWGRRVCAAAVRRGVLLRPLGDVIVLVPPLTTTTDQVALLVDALGSAIEEVCG